MQASLRRANGSLLVYLDSSSEDIGILRRAIATTAHEIRGPVAVLLRRRGVDHPGRRRDVRRRSVSG